MAEDIPDATRDEAAVPTPSDAWGVLMVAAQGGDGVAYRRLLTEIDPWLRRFYARRLPPATVEDAAQDALIAIHTKRHTFEAGRPFRPWLAAVARYRWIDRLRAMARDTTDALGDHEIAVADHETAVTSASVLHRLLAELKPAQASVIRLVKLDGCSIEEASAATGQSASLVKVNIHRGLAKLAVLVRTEESAE